MLGHSSATMTMDTYRHLFENRLDEVANAMDAARSVARAARESAFPMAQPVTRGRFSCCPGVAKADPIDQAEVRARVRLQVGGRSSQGAPGRVRTYAPPPESPKTTIEQHRK
jgi:hypothetical protein